LAYVIQESNWNFATANRKETKHRDREKLDDASQGDDEENPAAKSPRTERTDFYSFGQDVEGNCFRKNAILQIEQLVRKDKKLADYFSACQKACSHGLNCSDAEVARFMGRTRACTGLYRKKLIRLLADNGLDFNILVATAA
jgi:hypothetical protein